LTTEEDLARAVVDILGDNSWEGAALAHGYLAHLDDASLEEATRSPGNREVARSRAIG